MSNYEQLSQAIKDVIKANGKQEITGQVLQSALLSIISSVEQGALFAGVAKPSTNPGTPDQNVFYIATENGTYANFGGITVNDEVAILKNVDNTWTKTNTGIATIEKITELESRNSFIQVKQIDKIERLKWISAFKNVNISFIGVVPNNYPDTKIALSLVRRTSESSHEVRFKIFNEGSWSFIGQNWSQPDSQENINGLTRYTFESPYNNGNVKITCDIDWKIFEIGFSQFVDGDSKDSEPYYILSPDNIYLFDVNSYQPVDVTKELNKRQNNITGKNAKSFVPECSIWAGNTPKKIYVFVTPYKFSDNLNFNFEVVAKTSSPKKRGYKLLSISFWARNNSTWNYYTPIYSWSDANDTPVSLAVNRDGYICIVLGDDNNPVSNYLGNNLMFFVKKVVIDGVGFLVNEPKYEGWSCIGIDSIDSNYTNVYACQSYKFASTEYVDEAVKNIDATAFPIKPNSFAIFGSSKSTTRNAYTGWLRYALIGLLKKAGYTTSIMTSGKVVNRPYNGKCLTNTAEGIINKKIQNVGSFIEFSVYGSHVNIVQLIERTTDYAEFDIFDNDVKVGSYNNKNMTMLGSMTQTFKGDGQQRSFVIDYLDSYDFTVKVNSMGKTVSMSPTLSGADCYAVRTIMVFSPYNDGNPRRILYFPTAPSAEDTIEVSYNVGRAIGFIQTDYNEDERNVTESADPVYIDNLQSVATYQKGYPLSPVVFNEKSVLRLSFDGYKMHKIKLVITGGVNPYISFDFASAEINGFINAAFGGYDLQRANSESRWRDWRCIRYLSQLDKLLLEYGTNDDRYEIDRVFVKEQNYTLEQIKGVKLKDVVYITNEDNTTFRTGLCTGTIKEITPFSLISEDIKTSEIDTGDYVKIGEYRSDWREFTVRKIKTVDKGSGTITWDVPFSATEIWHYNNLDEMKGAQFSVRRLGEVKSRYKELIDKFKLTNPSAELIVVGMSAFNNNDYCSGWGYSELQQELVAEYHGRYVDVAKEQVRYNDGGLSSNDAKSIAIDSTGKDEYVVSNSLIGNVNRAMRVLVNGKDVTGINAYIERTDGWYVKDDIEPSQIKLNKGDDWNKITAFAKDYDSKTLEKPIKVKFYKNVPSSDDEIKLIIGGYGWSDDGIHQTDGGNQVYGSQILKTI